VEEVEGKGTCVHVVINEDVSIEGLEFKLLDDERKVINSMKVNSREIYLCVSLAKPEFVQLGDSVKYVDGSGKEVYGK
jgi:hypothetical protein